ncbi:MAG: hypothetical protein OXR07_05500 [Nitrospira sp.]|nr:hypothetical protein [Nitrospira sp.]
MPVNVLRRDVPKGHKPPGWVSTRERGSEADEHARQREADLAVQEQEALWESQETGIVHWSGEEGKRYSD